MKKNKKIIIAICIVILVIIGIFAWIKLHNTFDKSNPLIFEKGLNENYSYVIYQGKEYIPYCAYNPKEREKYLGYVGEDKQDEIYTVKGYLEEEWLINYLDSGMMNDCILLKEKSVTDIPNELTSEYEWNKKTSTNSYIPNGITVAKNSSVNNQNTTIAIDNSSGETLDIESTKSPENVAIEVLEDTITRDSVTILITDNNENKYNWGVEFGVQKKVNGEWENLKYVSDRLTWNSIAYTLNENNQLTQKLDIKYYYGTLENGIYRIVKPTGLYSNEFEIK